MHILLSALARYEPPIPRDAPYDLLPEPVNLLISLVFGVVLVLGRNWIADLFASVTGWGPGYHRSCVRFFAVAGTLQVIAVVVEALRLLL
jgi:hypothetical protein